MHLGMFNCTDVNSFVSKRARLWALVDTGREAYYYAVIRRSYGDAKWLNKARCHSLIPYEEGHGTPVRKMSLAVVSFTSL